MVEYNPYAYETHEDPHPIYTQLRGRGALARLEALEEVWRRMPGYQVVPEGAVRVYSVKVRGCAVEFSP